MAWLIFLVLCVLFPVALYCFFLALLNRRRHPTMIAGPWDFAGVLFALSGIFLIAGPLILAALNQTMRSLWLRSESASAAVLGEYWWYVRVILWSLYFGAITGGSIFLLWKRARTTSIYNVDPPALEEALTRVLNRLQMKWARARNQVFVDFSTFPEGAVKEGKVFRIRQTAIVSQGSLPGQETEELQSAGESLTVANAAVQAPEIMSQQSVLVLALDPFPAMHHVSLQWPKEADPWRKAIEAELAYSLLEVRPEDNPAGVWLLSIGSTLLCLIFFTLTVLVFVSLLPRAG